MRKTFSPLIAFVLVLSFLFPTKVHAAEDKISFTATFPKDQTVMWRHEYRTSDGTNIFLSNEREFTFTFSSTVEVDDIDGQNLHNMYNYIIYSYPSVTLSDDSAKTETQLEDVRLYLIINGTRYEISSGSTALYNIAGCNKIGIEVEADVYAYTDLDVDIPATTITASCTAVNGHIRHSGNSDFFHGELTASNTSGILTWLTYINNELLEIDNHQENGFSSLVTWLTYINDALIDGIETLHKDNESAAKILDAISNNLIAQTNTLITWFGYINTNLSDFKVTTVTWFQNLRDTINSGIANLIADIDTNFANLTSKLQTWYNGLTTNLRTWFDRQHDDMLNLQEELSRGYESEEGDSSVSDFDSSASEFEESQGDIMDSASSGLDGFTVPDNGLIGLLSGATLAIPLVSAMLQSMYESMGAFGSLVGIGMTMTIACMLLGFFKFYK